MFLYLPNECGRVAASSKLEPEAELHDPLGSLGGCENLAPATQATYVHPVSMFARYLGRLPEMLGPEEIARTTYIWRRQRNWRPVPSVRRLRRYSQYRIFNAISRDRGPPT